MMSNISKKTLILLSLLVLEYALGLIRFFYFIQYTDIANSPSNLMIWGKALLIAIVITLLVKQRKEGILIAWLLVVVSILSIFSWIFYYYATQRITIGFLLLSGILFVVNIGLIICLLGKNSGSEGAS